MYSFKFLKECDFNEYLITTENYSIFLSKEWLNFLRKSHDLDILYIGIFYDNSLVGFFIGGVFQIFGIKILGSPFRGWSTVYMGFFMNKKNDPYFFFNQFISFIFNNTNILFIELINKSQFDFSCDYYNVTNRIHSLLLNINECSLDEIFDSFKGDAKTYIRQFEKRGASVVYSEPGIEFANVYYNQLIEVFNYQGLKPNYSREKVYQLFENIPKDLFLCLKVVNSEGMCVATSIFFGYNEDCYFFGAASLRNYLFLRPNEYMVWTALKHFKSKGFKKFDLVGARDYKLKFAPQSIYYQHMVVSKYKILFYLRNSAEKIFFWFLKKNKFQLFMKKINNRVSSNLLINEVLDYEIEHFRNSEVQILSKFNRITILDKAKSLIIQMPVTPIFRILGLSRLIRRLFRLDKCNVLPTDTGFIVIWQSFVYHVSNDSFSIKPVFRLESSRNALHNSIASVNKLVFYFGEYGQPSSKGKPVYRTTDGGQSWHEIYRFPADKIRHIHCCKYDSFENKIWVFTGDFDGQCHVLSADLNFSELEWLGDGTQEYRAVDAIFEENSIHWIMDSPLKEVRHITLDRLTRNIQLGYIFPGPVWYLKKFTDGVVLAITVQEIGPSHKDNKMHMYATRNYRKWTQIGSFEHDKFPKGYFKFGVGCFSEGDQSTDSFNVFFEAVRGLDGKLVSFTIKGI
jgi:hypothetical protein